jgi:hypothetical protein
MTRSFKDIFLATITTVSLVVVLLYIAFGPAGWKMPQGLFVGALGIRFNRSCIWPFAIAAVFGYFALALYFDRTFVDPRPSGKVVIYLTRPYWHEAGFAYRVSHLTREQASKLAKIPANDPTNEDDTTSPIQIYEDGKSIGLSTSRFLDISKVGRGRFAHWREQHIIFSSSDNTDPRINGRRYWAVVP